MHHFYRYIIRNYTNLIFAWLTKAYQSAFAVAAFCPRVLRLSLHADCPEVYLKICICSLIEFIGIYFNYMHLLTS